MQRLELWRTRRRALGVGARRAPQRRLEVCVRARRAWLPYGASVLAWLALSILMGPLDILMVQQRRWARRTVRPPDTWSLVDAPWTAVPLTVLCVLAVRLRVEVPAERVAPCVS